MSTRVMRLYEIVESVIGQESRKSSPSGLRSQLNPSFTDASICHRQKQKAARSRGARGRVDSTILEGALDQEVPPPAARRMRCFAHGQKTMWTRDVIEPWF